MGSCVHSASELRLKSRALYIDRHSWQEGNTAIVSLCMLTCLKQNNDIKLEEIQSANYYGKGLVEVR